MMPILNIRHLQWITIFLSSTTSTRAEAPKRISSETCKLFMAPSTIPNAGIGVFTAVDLKEGERVGYPDQAIPVMDIDWHNGGDRHAGDYHWLWKNYDWLSSAIGDTSFEAEAVVACIPGVGAMPNCHFRLSNVHEGWTRYDTAGLHRSKDPGIGAFTGYHGREATATKDLREGSEIYVDYGEHWFTMRENELGLVPIADSYVQAEPVLNKYHELELGDNEDAKSDLWDLIKGFAYKSRSLSALPRTYAQATRAIEVGIKQTELEDSIRSVEWLRENGKCLDNLRPGISTISGAGRGAFATRFIPKGDIVAPSPLVHIPHKDSLLLFGEAKDQFTREGYTIRNTSDIKGHQLLLNYCFGHSKSTLLLCPYGSGISYINHNHQNPNAKIVWADPSRAMIHNSTWLTKTVDFLEDQLNPGLEFDYVAIRDIEPGEEVSIDYGKEWEDSWNAHLKDWKPLDDADSYVDASQLNCYDAEECKNKPVFRTHEEQLEKPYSDQLLTFCYFNYWDEREEMVWDDDLDDWREPDGDNKFKYTCTITERSTASDGSSRYTAELIVPAYDDDGDHTDNIPVEVEDIPQWGIKTVNKRYTSDMHASNVFRHEMIIPDSIFPASWMNLQ